MSLVALVKCESYAEDEVLSAVKRGFDLLNLPMERFSAGEKILLKPNLLAATAPEKSVTTHPSVFKAVATVLREYGVKLTYGDSPAVAAIPRSIRNSGLADVANELNIPLADFETGSEIDALSDSLIRKFMIARGVLQSDGIVSLCKMKTHGFQIITGAVKNQFGCIPGIRKGEFHVRLPDPFDFGRMLVDLTRRLQPRMYIMDAVVAMEGNGPAGGSPRSMNLLIFSFDPVAMDTVFARLAGLEPLSVPVLYWADKIQFGSVSNIELLGDPFEIFQVANFEIPKQSIRSPESFLIKTFRNRIISRPVIEKSRCVKCGDCTNVCPVDPKAIYFKSAHQPPLYNYSLCIRCYCCQEVCPESAISIKTPFLGKLLKLQK